MGRNAKNITTRDFQPDFISGRERLYTLPEVAIKLGRARSTVHRLVRRGELGYVLKTGFARKVYHVPESALKSYVHIQRLKKDLRHAEKANVRLNRELIKLRKALGEEERKGRRKRIK